MCSKKVLPRDFRPTRYHLSLRDLDFEAWTFQGVVSIDLEPVRSVKDIVINATHIEITAATVYIGSDDDGHAITSTEYNYQRQEDTVTISFEQQLPIAQPCRLTIEYTGNLNTESEGFYRARYQALSEPPASVARSHHGFVYMLCTQFQPVGARRAFPCFDEPNMKATFVLDIEVPNDQTAISNTPVNTIEHTRPGWKRVSFEETPVMSTYLLAWALGDFRYIESHTTQQYRGSTIPVRFYATAGLEDHGHFALEETVKAIDIFSRAFGIDYPLPKLDVLAVPEFTFGAMENWGLLAGKSVLLLFDPKTGSASKRMSISKTIMHEVAHQWFGNLVTMDWWDELWLNEGFATWASLYAVNLCHPEWNTWEDFISQDMEAALARDAMRSSHPIHVDVPDARNVHEIFDMISYQKSCAVINMLANHMGLDKFLSGLAGYLKQNTYQNSTAEALWHALAEISGDDIVTNIKPWITKVGYPKLVVQEKDDHLVMKQSRFIAADDMTTDEDETIWWIPLGFRCLANEAEPDRRLALSQKHQSIPIAAQDDLYLFNSSGTGFYRVEYDTAHLLKLSVQPERLGPLEKMTIMGSASALAFSGEGSTLSLLAFLRALEQESDILVWLKMVSDFTILRKRFDSDIGMITAIKKLILEVIANMARKVGWETIDGESDLQSKLRESILAEAYHCDSVEIIEVACQKNEDEQMQTHLDPGIRYLLWGAAASMSPHDAASQLITKWRQSTSSELKLHAIVALSMISDPEVIQNVVLPFCYDTNPEDRVLQPTSMRLLVSSLANHARSRHLQWEYLKNHWDAVSAKMGTPQLIARIVNAALTGFKDNAVADDIGEFFADKDTTGYALAVQKAKDNIAIKSRYLARERAPLQKWLRKESYMCT